MFNIEPVEAALTRDAFLSAGEDIGLDVDSFMVRVEDGRHNNTISTNQAVARIAKVNSTPSFFVNDQIIRGNVPLEEFERRFNEALGS